MDEKPDYGLKMKLRYATSVFDSVYQNRGVAWGSIMGRHPPPTPTKFLGGRHFRGILYVVLIVLVRKYSEAKPHKKAPMRFTAQREQCETHAVGSQRERAFLLGRKPGCVRLLQCIPLLATLSFAMAHALPLSPFYVVWHVSGTFSDSLESLNRIVASTKHITVT